MSLCTLKDILSNTTFDNVWDSFIKQYPDMTHTEKHYTNIYKTLAAIQPVDNTDNITIKIELINEEQDEKWFSIYGISPDLEYNLNLSYTKWEKWLGYYIDNSAINLLSPSDIIAHCLWEMTFNGFTEETVQASIITMQEHIRKSEKFDGYRNLIKENNYIASNCLLEEILDEYSRTNSDFAESLIIEILKKDWLKPEQLSMIENKFDNKEINKQLYIFKARDSIKNGNLLERIVINKLIDLKAFDFLEYALDCKAVTKDALDEFKSPEKAESFRKAKIKLYEKSQLLKKHISIKKISFASPLSEIEDIENDNIDVFVELEDGFTYTVVVSTPKNYYWYMDKEGIDYIPASAPDIIVRKLTEENIRAAIQSFVEDSGYWLKLYALAGNRFGAFDIKLMNKIIKEIHGESNRIFDDITK